jgi:CHAT domain-containing protein
MNGGLADVAMIRAQQPLPETAAELCIVRGDLGARREDIHLGAGATERAVKELSESGKLATYRIVHFATHGALAGQLSGGAEPGLLLTPPAEASELDDGYLTASEIATLKLDADWAILSACNTAAGGAEGAAALSGLARAFIYAQARALLVSHWAVDSAATVKLVTGAVKHLRGEKPMGRAEALRQSMLAMIRHGGEREAQPAYWAPFVLVGEGAR